MNGDAIRARLISLTDGTTNALVYPERGFQLFGFETSVAGRPVQLIHAPQTEREPDDRRYGNPILFPAVGVSNGSRGDNWDHGGVALPMPSHGWARNVYWQVEEIRVDRVTARLLPHTGFRAAFPFDFEMGLTYRLQAGTLVLDAAIVNKGAAPFPYAFGLHPYLRAPLESSGQRARCVVKLPAGTRLQSSDGWRTITREKAAARTVASTAAELPNSVLLADTGSTALEVEDQAAGIAARVSVEGSEQTFPLWVVWSASPEAPYICLEPWTDAPNALNRAGTRAVEPGATHRYRVTLSARAL